jgi:hypothetical protein
MKNSKILVVLTGAFLIVALPSVAVSQDKATAQEVVAKVKEAASTLSKTGDLAQFNQKQSPWVWKGTYIFVHDCDKKVNAAHPFKPEQIGQDLTSIKGTDGKSLYPDPEAFAMQRGSLRVSGSSIGGRSPARRRGPARSAIT